MDDFEKNPLIYLKNKLSSKAKLKQKVWKNAIRFFDGLKMEAEAVILELTEKDRDDDGIRLEFKAISDFEFHVYFGSDLVVFSLQTNIITFDSSHYLMQNKYLQQDIDLTFFGQILIYDFMADSLLYNRTEDTGYLLGRILVNRDNHFMIEGVRDLHYLFEGIEKAVGSKENNQLLIYKSLAVAIDSDLLAPDFKQLQFTTLGVRMKADRELGHGAKIGFQLSTNDDIRA